MRKKGSPLGRDENTVVSKLDAFVEILQFIMAFCFLLFAIYSVRKLYKIKNDCDVSVYLSARPSAYYPTNFNEAGIEEIESSRMTSFGI
jgi:hypothetical protein